MPSPPVWVLEAMIAGKAGAFSNRSWTASSGASRWMKSPIRATALRATSGVDIRRRGDARYQIVHLTLLGRAERPAALVCVAARGGEIKRARAIVVVAALARLRNSQRMRLRHKGAGQPGAGCLWRRTIIKS